MRQLRAPVGAVASSEALVGAVGALLHPLASGQTSKVRLVGGSAGGRELLAVLAADSGPLPKETRVLVLAVRDGRAVVTPAEAAMLAEADILTTHAARETERTSARHPARPDRRTPA